MSHRQTVPRHPPTSNELPVFPGDENVTVYLHVFHIVKISFTLKTVVNINLEFNGLSFLNSPHTVSSSLLIFRCVSNKKLKTSLITIACPSVGMRIPRNVSLRKTCRNIPSVIQGVPGGMCHTSGECSLR